MFRVVLDTNVVISSFWGGKPKKIINLWNDGAFVLCLSEEILEEYLEVLTRMGTPAENIDDLLLILKANIDLGLVHLSYPSHHHQIIKEDPDDNIFIDCAVESQAGYIISGDNHLLRLREFKNIKILPPHFFLELIE